MTRRKRWFSNYHNMMTQKARSYQKQLEDSIYAVWCTLTLLKPKFSTNTEQCKPYVGSAPSVLGHGPRLGATANLVTIIAKKHMNQKLMYAINLYFSTLT